MCSNHCLTLKYGILFLVSQGENGIEHSGGSGISVVLKKFQAAAIEYKFLKCGPIFRSKRVDI